MIPQNAMPHTDPILFYDGTCGFCSRQVQFVLRHERRHTLRFAPLQGPTAAALRARHPHLAQVDSVIWYTPPAATHPEKVCTRSAAVLAVLRYLGGPWRILTIAWLIPRPLRDALYILIARHRHDLTPSACPLPPAEGRARFIH